MTTLIIPQIFLAFVVLLGAPDHKTRESTTHDFKISTYTYVSFKWAAKQYKHDPEILARLKDICEHKWLIAHHEKYFAETYNIKQAEKFAKMDFTIYWNSDRLED